MNINYFKPEAQSGKAKCTIHISGKLGFSNAAAEKLSLNSSKCVKFGSNSDNSDDNSLYMVICIENDIDCFKVNKAGRYFYINTKELFDSMEFDYTNQKVIFDIFQVKNEVNIYKLILRKIKRKQTKGGE